MSTHNKSIYLVIAFAFIGSCSIYNNRSHNIEVSQNEMDMLTLDSKAKGSRTTQLGVIKKTDKEPTKEFQILMSDPALNQKWDLALIQSREAWKKSIGSRKIVVAIIDTGIDVNHPDLKNNIWVNEKELHGKPGVDDDHNGFIDDIHGWNFVDNNNDLTDNHGHGTHIAGIIGAEGGNGIGISGVAPKVSLMSLKYYDPKAPGKNNLVNTIRALKYAVDQKDENGKPLVSIINYSGGGVEQSPIEKDLVRQARAEGILVVAAAGNEQSNSDVHGYYPADYDFDNIISVTAIDQNQNVLPSSNYGTTTVDIAAPGNNILSTLPGGGYGYMTGTSQATAFVTGLAVLLKAHFKDHAPDKIIRQILSTGNWDDRLIGKTKTTKILNTARALQMLDNGVGRTGVIATNEANMNHDMFATSREGASVSTSGEAADPGKEFSDLTKVLNAQIEKRKAQDASLYIDEKL